MRTGLVILSFIGCAGIYLSVGKTSRQLLPEKRTDTLSHRIDFKTEIQPILQKNCSPCHFPGGKLYEKLPFDNGNTILTLKTGVPKRTKDEKEKALINAYIEQNSPAGK